MNMRTLITISVEDDKIIIQHQRSMSRVKILEALIGSIVIVLKNMVDDQDPKVKEVHQLIKDQKAKWN
jgi:hypothetical protein